MDKKDKNVITLLEATSEDVNLVGGKNASLGEMITELTPKGVAVPGGFAVTSTGYWKYIKENELMDDLEEIIEEMDPTDIKSLQKAGKKARKLIMGGDFSEELENDIISAYGDMCKKYGKKGVDVAIRSSAVCEDAPDASFAGQFETFLNVSGKKNIFQKIKDCFASAFNDRVISYREEKNVNHLEFAVSVGVQKMVRSDKASSGVMFTIDTETGFDNIVLINSIWGLGEMIVQGGITPDEFYVFKPSIDKEGKNPIIRKDLGRKTKKYVYKKRGGLKEEKVDGKKQLEFSLDDDEIQTLAKWATIIEDHYGKPQDIEWAKDGETDELFIVQSRPETVHAPDEKQTYKEYRVNTDKTPLVTGIAVGEKIGQGKVKVLKDVSEMDKFEEGDVLVTGMTDPDWVSIMRIASAIITDEGGKTCFAGGTKVLTDGGALPIEKLVKQVRKGEEFKVPSLNRETLEIEWKRVVDGMEREAEVTRVSVSQKGTGKNMLEVTPDHEFLTFENRQLITKEIQELCEEERKIINPVKIPRLDSSNFSEELGYLLGAIISDGHISWRKYDGKLKTQLYFIQKPTEAKEDFIQKVKDCFKKEYDYDLTQVEKKPGGGTIKGRKIKGERAISLKCSKREIIRDFKEKQERVSQLLLRGNQEFVLSFLAGMVDGDGTYNESGNRIQVFCSKEKASEAVISACLREGINFQTTNNRDIDNIQLVDGVEKIFKYTSRVKGDYKREDIGTRLFAAGQLLGDIIERVNYKGRVKPYVKKNLLIDAEKIERNLIPMIKGAPENHELTKIVKSPLKMSRVKSRESLGEKRVYNIEVEDNHNYTVLTDKGTPVMVNNCHAAIVGRELGIPNIVGTENATDKLETGETVTVDCTQGSTGRVFEGKIDYEVEEHDLGKIPELNTGVLMNIGTPEIAFKHSFLPNDGVGLARVEFILAEHVKVHPMALYNFEKIEDGELKDKIAEITVEHKDKKEHFIKELAEGVAQIAAAFYPKPVLVRLSDFKSNEYKNLVGGELYETEESNPMIGFRGASRYADEDFRPAFEMECEAMRRVRETFGLDNVNLMVPFCRKPEEGDEVLKIMADYGLTRDKMDIYVMAEIPSNVILVKEFAKRFDGFSIGSNDLTQLTLGVDRDNGKLKDLFNENNPAVRKTIAKFLWEAHELDKPVGICGEAPATTEGFVEFLVKCGIDTISVNPESIIKTYEEIEKHEH